MPTENPQLRPKASLITDRDGEHVATVEPNGGLDVNIISGGVGQDVVELGGDFDTDHVSVLNTATLIAAANAARRGIMVTNLGTTDVYVGSSAVTTSNGQLLLGTKGAFIVIPTVQAVYGIVGTGSQAVSYIEVF